MYGAREIVIAVAILAAVASAGSVRAGEPGGTAPAGPLARAGAALPSALPQVSFADVLAHAVPAVVTVRVTSEVQVPVELGPQAAAVGRAPPVRRRARSGGSGVIIDAAGGHILTNNHVIDGAVEIEVVLADGRLLPAKLIGRDVGTDLAVLEVADRRLKAMAIGDSDGVRVGDIVLAIGNPFGLEGTATMGIVSASMRSEIGHEAFEDFFQIDAVINPGNSGGALVNVRGELIGINTATAGNAGNVGIGFAIPINMARVVKGEIVRHGRMRRGSLGLIVEDLSYETAARLMSGTNRGAMVRQVVPGSPAAQAGIPVGAIVTEISGKPVRSSAELSSRVVTVPLGTMLVVMARIDGIDRRFELRTAEVAETGAEVTLTAADGGLDGLAVVDIAPGNPVFGDIRGAQVSRVMTGSPASRIGLVTGDVIVGLDDADIRHTEHLLRFAARAPMSYRLRIKRGSIDGWLRVIR